MRASCLIFDLVSLLSESHLLILSVCRKLSYDRHQVNKECSKRKENDNVHEPSRRFSVRDWRHYAHGEVYSRRLEPTRASACTRATLETTDQQKRLKWRDRRPIMAYIAVMRSSLELLSGILTRIGIYKDREGEFESLASSDAIKRKRRTCR